MLIVMGIVLLVFFLVLAAGVFVGGCFALGRYLAEKG